MTLNLDIKENSKITLTPKDTLEEIIQNINVIVSTIVGEVPLDRALGIDAKLLDNSSIKGKSKLMIYIIESLQEYEPRIEISNIEFIQDEKNADKGIFFPRLEVHIKDEFIS